MSGNHVAEVRKTKKKAAELFELHVKPVLAREFQGELLSIENTVPGGDLADVLDRGSGSDLVLSYLAQGGCIYTVASRIRFLKLGKEKHSLDFTFRNSFPRDGAPCFDAELSKLLAAKRAIFEEERPAILPLYTVVSRLRELEEGGHRLHDLAYVETRRILEVIEAEDKFHLAEMRERQQQDPGKPRYRTQSKTCRAGIQYNSEDGTSFVFLSLAYLEQFDLGIVYRRIY